jgi:hypothetical protein
MDRIDRISDYKTAANGISLPDATYYVVLRVTTGRI